MTCDLKNDSVVKEYIKYHSDKYIWPEVQEAAKVSGYESIEIYQFDKRLVMILKYPENMNIDSINACYANSHPETLAKWSKIMGALQTAPPGADSSKTWIAMEKIYNFKKTE